MGQTASRLPL